MMERLIDTELQPIQLTNYIIDREDTFIMALKDGEYDILLGMLMDYINAQPTVFDVDAIIEQLNNYALEAEKEEMNAESFPEAQVFKGKYIAYKQAINIIKNMVNKI